MTPEKQDEYYSLYEQDGTLYVHPELKLEDLEDEDFQVRYRGQWHSGKLEHWQHRQFHFCHPLNGILLLQEGIVVRFAKEH